MSFLVFTGLLSLLVATAYLFVKHKLTYWKRRGMPYLEPTFPFGNFGKMFMQKTSLADLLTEFYNSCNEPVFGIYSTLRPSLFVRDPKTIQDILCRDFSSFSHHGMQGNEKVDPMANNMLLQNGDKWKRSRTLVSPAFTSGKLKAMFDTIVECGNSLHKYIDQYATSGETLEVRDIFARFTTNVIASVSFGIEVDSIANPNTEFRQYGKRIFEPTFLHALRGSVSFMSPWLARLLRLRFTDKDIGDFMIETVRQNLEYREKNNVVRKDFFQLLMQLRNTGKVNDDGDWSTEATNKEKQMSLEEMAAQAFLFFAGGFESASTTMSFFIYELAKSQEAQIKAYEEIVKILDNHDRKLTYESMNEMKYIENCLDETLRLHPPFGAISRQSTKEYKFPFSNSVIEKDTKIIIPVTALHYDSKYYVQPTKFIPERFDEKNRGNKTFADMPFLAFGDGPRNCIGLRLAKLQVKLAVVLLLQKFKFELGEQHVNKELEINPRGVVKTPMHGINLKVKRR